MHQNVNQNKYLLIQIFGLCINGVIGYTNYYFERIQICK